MISSLILGSVLLTRALAASTGRGGSGQPASAAVQGDSKVPVLIGMKQKNIENMMDYVMEVSDPASAKYGQHYSQAQVDALFAPDDQAIASVKDWLVKSGIAADSISLSRSKAWVKFESTVSTLESLLSVNLTEPNKAKRDVRSEVKLPQNISSVVEFVLPSLKTSSNAATGRRAKNRGRLSTKPFRGDVDSSSLDTCNQVVTPACIRAMYKIPKPSGGKPAANNVVGMFETADDYYNQADMDQFLLTAAQDISATVKPIKYLINGAKLNATRDQAGFESNLDFQMTAPMIYPQQTALYQVEYPKYGMQDFNFIFAHFQDALIGPYCGDHGDQGSGVDCGQYPVPSVLSVSWGGSEPLDPYPSGVDVYKRICNEWGKLALQGTTVLIASGDNGVDGNGNSNCDKDARFLADGAGSCPYVTSVGATYLPPGTPVDGSEVAVTRYGSGGGFSNIFDMPPWQKKAVSTYLTQHDPKVPEANFNKSGRAFPDIAAVGDNGFVVTQGQQVLGGGTSMSAPIVAGIFNLINEERLAAGKSTLGFVNPALYKALDENKDVFNDITVGSNPGSLTGQCHTQGFQAAPGWDPVTGLGTPNYPKLRDYFMSLGK